MNMDKGAVKTVVPPVDRESQKLKLKLKFKDSMPKEGVDLLGIAKKLSTKKFVK